MQPDESAAAPEQTIPGYTGPAVLSQPDSAQPFPAAQPTPAAPTAPAQAGPGKPKASPAPPSSLNFFSHHVQTTMQGLGQDEQLAGMNLARSNTNLPVKLPKRAEAEEDYRKFVKQSGLEYDGNQEQLFDKYYKTAEKAYRDFTVGNFNALNVKSGMENSSHNMANGIFNVNQANNKRVNLPQGIDLASGMSMADPRPLVDIMRDAAGRDENVDSNEYVQEDTWQQIIKNKHEKDGLIGTINPLTKAGKRDKDGNFILEKAPWPSAMQGGVIVDVDENGDVRPVRVSADDDAFAVRPVISDWSYSNSDNKAVRTVERLVGGVAGGLVKAAANLINVQQAGQDYMDNLGRGVLSYKTEPYRTGHDTVDQLLDGLGVKQPKDFEFFEGGATLTDRLLGTNYESSDTRTAKQLLLLGTRMQMGRSVDERGQIFNNKYSAIAGVTDVAAQLVPQLGMGLLSGGASIGYSALDGYGSVYKDFRERGATVTEGRVAGVIGGLITGASEKMLSGTWISRITKGNRSAHELMEKPLVAMVRQATEEVTKELEAKGIAVTERTLMEGMSARTPGMITKFTNSMSALSAKAEQLGSKLSSNLGKGSAPINWADVIKGAHHEGLQEVIEGFGQQAESQLYDNFVFAGQSYSMAGLAAPDRLQVDIEAEQQRRQQTTWKSFLEEQLESYVLGAAGGGIGEAPYVLSTRIREQRQQAEQQDLQHSLIQHIVDNKGEGMQKLKDRALALGKEGRWGTSLTRQQTTPQDGQESENDYLTQGVLNQIELIERLAHESGVFDRLKKGTLTVQNAVGSLSAYVNQNELFKRGLTDLLTVDNARKDRDDFLKNMMAPPAATVPGPNGQPVTKSVLQMSPGEIQAERQRRLEQAEQLTDAVQKAKSIEYINQRYQTAQDTTAQGMIARFESVYDYYEAGRRKAETQQKLDMADASDAAGVQAMRDQYDKFDSDQQLAFKTMESELGTNPDLNRARQLADKQLAFDALASRSRSVYDGTIVRNLTQESFLRKHYLDLSAQFADTEGFNKLSVQDRQFLMGQLAALNDPTQGFFDEKAQLKVNGEDLRRLAFSRKLRAAQLGLGIAQQQNTQLEAVTSLNVIPATLLAQVPGIAAAGGNGLVSYAQQAQALADSLSKGSQDFDGAEGLAVAKSLRELAETNLAPLRDAVRQNPENSRQAYYDQALDDMEIPAGTPLSDPMVTAGYEDFINEKLSAVTEAASEAAISAADSLEKVVQNPVAFQAAPLPAPDFIEHLLATTIGSEAGMDPTDLRNSLTERIAEYQAIAQKDPAGLARLQDDSLSTLRGAIMRNIVSAEINDKVNNLLYARLVAGKAVEVEAKPKPKPELDPEQMAIQAAVAAGQPIPTPTPKTDSERLEEEGEDAGKKVEEKTVAAPLSKGKTRRERVTDLLDAIMEPQKTAEAFDVNAPDNSQLRSEAIRGGFFKRLLYATEIVKQRIEATTLERVTAWADGGNWDGDPESWEDKYQTEMLWAAGATQREMLAQAKVQQIPAVAMILGKLAAGVMEFFKPSILGGYSSVNNAPFAAVITGELRLKQLQQALRNGIDQAFVAVNRGVREEAKAVWKWNAPFGDTSNLHYQSEDMYALIYDTSRQQLAALDELELLRSQALANRGAVDLKRRVTYLQQQTDKLLNSIIIPTSVLKPGTPEHDKLAQAQQVLDALGTPANLGEIGDYQVQLAQAEQLLREAFAKPADQHALAAEILETASKEVLAGGTSGGVQTMAKEGYRRMLEFGDSRAQGMAYVLNSLFGADRATVAGQYNGWLTRTFPKINNGENPTPSLEQEQLITQAVQALTAPWPFADDHVLTRNAADLSVARDTVFVTGFAGSGKTHMVAGPLTAILAGIAGAKPGASKFAMTATAPFDTQQQDISSSLARNADILDVRSADVEQVLSSLEDGSYPDNLLALDEATILTFDQSNRLFNGSRILNEQRRAQGRPPVRLVLVGDPAQLSGITTDHQTQKSSRLNRNHPVVETVVYPRMQPLKEIYRTGFVILDSAQTEYRKRILSNDPSFRTNNTPLQGQYELPIAGDYTSLGGLQYQTEDEQRRQIKQHIDQLEASGSKAELKVVVSADPDAVKREVDALGTLGVKNPASYVVAIDKAQGKTYAFTYVAVNELDSSRQFSGNDNLRATLVGVSRSKQYASVRTRLANQIDNKLETKLARFQDNEKPDSWGARGDESVARQKQVAKLAATAPNAPASAPSQPATPAAKPTASPAAQPAVASTAGPATAGLSLAGLGKVASPPLVSALPDDASIAPLSPAPTMPASDPTGMVGMLIEANERIAEARDIVSQAEQLLQSVTPGSNQEMEAVAIVANAKETLANAQGFLDDVRAEQDRQTSEVRGQAEQVQQQLTEVLVAVPSLTLDIASGTVAEAELDYQEVISAEGALDDSRQQLLRDAQAHVQNIQLLWDQAQQLGDAQLSAELTQILDQAKGIIAVEQRQQIAIQQGMLRVAPEDDLTQNGSVASLASAKASEEQAPGIAITQQVVGNEVRVGTIIASIPIYDPVTNAFDRMDPRTFEPVGKTTLERLNSAQAFIRQQIKEIRASRVQFQKRQVATLAAQGRVVVSSFLSPKRGLIPALFNKSKFLRKLLGDARLTSDQSLVASSRWFEDYYLENGTVLKGKGKFYLRHFDSYEHGQPLPSDTAGEFNSNIHEIFYQETVNGIPYEVSVGMVQREPKAAPGEILRVQKDNALSNLLKSAVGGVVELGDTLPLENVRPPVFLGENPQGTPPPKRSVRAFREDMNRQNVGVSSPFCITVSSNDDFAQGNYSFYHGDIDDDGNPVEGGRKMLSGRAVVFTAFGYSNGEITEELNNLLRQGVHSKRNPDGLQAHEIITTLRTKFDAEMVLLENSNTTLANYTSVVLNTPEGTVSSVDELLRRRRTTYDPGDNTARDGIAQRSSENGVDQRGLPSDPAIIELETMRTFFTSNQGRFINTPKELASKDQTLNRGGIINKFIRLFTDEDLGLMTQPSLGKVKLTEKAKQLLNNEPELISHLEAIVSLLIGRDAQRDTLANDTDENGNKRNPFWNAYYVGDLVLYLSYFDNKLDQALTGLWTADAANQIQINPSFGIGGRNNTFSPVVNPGRNQENSTEPVIQMDDMLETARTIKTYPSMVVNLQQIADRLAQGPIATEQEQDVPVTPAAAPLEVGAAPAPAAAAAAPAAVATVGTIAPPSVENSADYDSDDVDDAPAPRAARGQSPLRGRRSPGPSGSKNRLNQEGALLGDLSVRDGAQILERLLGTNPSAWLQNILDKNPRLAKVLGQTGLGLASYWQVEGKYPFSMAYGAVVNGFIELNTGLNGLMQSLTPRHEALHYVMLLLPTSKRDQIYAWARVAWEQQGNPNASYESVDDVEEWLTENYSRLFESGDSEATKRAERWKWLPGPVLRFFFNVRDASLRLEENDAAGQLNRFMSDIEGGRYRGLRVDQDVAQDAPDRLARNEAGLRARAYEATASLFGGRRQLSETATYLTQLIYDLRYPTTLDPDGKVREAVLDDGEAASIISEEMYAAYWEARTAKEPLLDLMKAKAGEYDYPDKEFSGYDRAIAQRLFKPVKFTDGVAVREEKSISAFNAIMGHTMQHVSGKLEVITKGDLAGQVRHDAEATSAISSMYDDDADKTDGEAQDADATNADDTSGGGDLDTSNSEAEAEAAIQAEDSIKMGKEYYMSDKNRLPRESAELQHHIGMTPLLQRGPGGIYQRSAQLLDKQLAFQILREAAVEASRLFGEDASARVVSYRHFAQALANVATRSQQARHDTAVSLLARFFDHSRQAGLANSAYSNLPDAGRVPSLYELAFPGATGRRDLRGDDNPLAAQSGKVLSQLYGFYNSLIRRNMLDVNLSGSTDMANEPSDGLTDLKNKANSSIVNALFMQDKNSRAWKPRLDVLTKLASHGFSFRPAPSGGGIELLRRHPGTMEVLPVFNFGKPSTVGGRGDYGFATGNGVTATINQDVEFFATALYDVLSVLGMQGYITPQLISSLVKGQQSVDASGKVSYAGARNLNKNAGKYVAMLLQPLVLEHLNNRDSNPSKPGSAALLKLGITSAVEGWFGAGVFRNQPKENLNVTVRNGAATAELHYSPTKSYSDAIRPMMDLFSSSSVRPERLNSYNAEGNRVALLQHGNTMLRQLRAFLVEQTRTRLAGKDAPVQPEQRLFNSVEDGYRNPVRTGDIRHTEQQVFTLGALEDSRTGRKHSLVGSSAREYTRTCFEKLFLQQLATSGGRKLILLGSAKADKETQTGHELEAAENAPSLVLVPSSSGAAKGLANLRASYDALLRHNVLPRLVAAGYVGAATAGPMAAQVPAIEAWLQTQTPQQLQGLKLVAGVDYQVQGGQVTGLGTGLRERVLLSDSDFSSQVQGSLDYEASQLYDQGFTYFYGDTVEKFLEATNQGQLKAQLTPFISPNNKDVYLTRIVNKETGVVSFNPLVKTFLLSQMVHRQSLESALTGSDVFFKPGKGYDGIDYAKRLILLTTNYEAYDLNAYGGLPLQSRLAIVRDEKLSDILTWDDMPDQKTERSAQSRYTYRHAEGNFQRHDVVSTDNGQFYAIFRAMAPGDSEQARDEWARDKIAGQALHDGLQWSTMLHDIQHLRSGLQPSTDESQRKTIVGGLMPDGIAILDKTSTARITNELLELGNQHLWQKTFNMLGGFTEDADGVRTPSPLLAEWLRIREELRQKYAATPGRWNQRVVRGNEDWKMLAKAVRANPTLELYHTGLLTSPKGVKVGVAGTADVLDNSYANATRLIDNRYAGTVLSLAQNLTEADISNITQENYIFSLQNLNWQTTQQINENLAQLSENGLLDMQQLVAELGGQEVFEQRAQEMLDNMGNVSNTNAMLGARMNPNLPLLTTVMGTAIASQIKAKMMKLRFSGGRFTVQCSSGRVNMYEVDGVGSMTQRQLTRDGYATINDRGQLVPTGKANFKIRELAFTHYKHVGGEKLTADEAEHFASLVKAGSEGDAEAAAEAAALAKGYEVMPMEVMVSRTAFAPFKLPRNLDLDQVTQEYFYTRERNRLASEAVKSAHEKYQDEQLRVFMAENSSDRPTNLDAQGLAEWDEKRAGDFSTGALQQYRTSVFETAVGEAERGDVESKAREHAADVWQNFLQRLEMKVTRIPVTGLNSIQVVKVVGFYDSQANTMILPSQVQTVAGADNDGDMVTVEYHDVPDGGRTWQPELDEQGKPVNQRALDGMVKNNLRAVKMEGLRNPLNILQLFHPIDFASLNTYKKAAIDLETGLTQSDKTGGVTPGYGPLGNMYRFAPTVSTIIKNQQGKSGVGPFVKLSQLYYQNVALLRLATTKNQQSNPVQEFLEEVYEKEEKQVKLDEEKARALVKPQDQDGATSDDLDDSGKDEVVEVVGWHPSGLFKLSDLSRASAMRPPVQVDGETRYLPANPKQQLLKEATAILRWAVRNGSTQEKVDAVRQLAALEPVMDPLLYQKAVLDNYYSVNEAEATLPLGEARPSAAAAFQVQELQQTAQVVGDLKNPIRYGQHVTTSTMQREVATANLLENVANGSLDNAKEDLLGWLNVNPQMWGTYSAMMFAQIPEQEIFRLLSHPYAKQIAEVAQRSRDVDARYSRSVADVAKGILTGDTKAVITNEAGVEEVISTGNMGYDSLRRNQKQAQKLTEQRRALAKKQVLDKGASQAEADLAAASVEEAEVEQARSLTAAVRKDLAAVTQVPNLESITQRRPKADHPDHQVRKFVVQQLFLFAQRGDELLQAQGVLRALEGPPGNELDSLTVLERVLSGIGYSPTRYEGDLDRAVADLKATLLNDGKQTRVDPVTGERELIPPITEEAKLALVRKQRYELVNMRAHVYNNPALASALRGLVFDYEQRREQFITRQAPVMQTLRKLMNGNRKFFAAGKGNGVLLREFRAWVDSRFLQAEPYLKVPTGIDSEGRGYLDDLSSYNLATIEGQRDFMEKAASYLYSLKGRQGSEGNRQIGDLGLMQQLMPRDNEHGRIVTLANSENLQPEEKAVLQAEFEELTTFGDEGLAVQNVLFTYALISRGLNVGKGSLAELVSPEAATAYSDFLGEQQAWFANPDNKTAAETTLAEFSREFQLLNPQAAPELRKPGIPNGPDGVIARSYYYDRELRLDRDPKAPKEGKDPKEPRPLLPLVISRQRVTDGNPGYLKRDAANMPPVMSIPNANVPGGFAVFELVPMTVKRTVTVMREGKQVSEEITESSYQYERRFSAATPQLNGYGSQAFSKLPILPLHETEEKANLTELLAKPASLLSQSVDRLLKAVAPNKELLQQLKDGTPVVLSNGEQVTLREKLECDYVAV